MVGFRKAKAEQAALKMGLYGPPGSGKTFTALLMAEGLAAKCNKRVAMVDTEHGSDFYCKTVASRQVHPAAFDFDAMYTKSITDVVGAVKSLKPEEYGVVILDSMTHLWQACIEAYGGKQTSAGTIPMHAWGKIKKPYKDLMSYLLSSPMHVIICGRQGVDYATDEETNELKAVGVKMKAEGETPYEPHILIRMESKKPEKTNELGKVIAYAEKDRTGVLAGRSFINPSYDDLCGPLIGLLGGSQARIATDDETAAHDCEQLSEQDRKRAKRSLELLEEMSAKVQLAKSAKELKDIGKTITPELKSQMLPQDVTTLRERYVERENSIRLRGPGDDLPAIDRSEPVGTTSHVGNGDPAPEPDPLFVEAIREAAKTLDNEQSITTFEADYGGRAKLDAERTIIEGLATEARKRLPAAKGKGQKAFA